MKRKTAVKLLMSLGYDRNSANEYLDTNRGSTYTHEVRVHGAWFMAFKDHWLRGEVFITPNTQ